MARRAKNAVERVVKALITRIDKRQGEAKAAISIALELATRGQTDQAVKALMDFEGPARDSLDLFTAALTIRRELGPTHLKRLPRRED